MRSVKYSLYIFCVYIYTDGISRIYIYIYTHLWDFFAAKISARLNLTIVLFRRIQ